MRQPMGGQRSSPTSRRHLQEFIADETNQPKGRNEEGTLGRLAGFTVFTMAMANGNLRGQKEKMWRLVSGFRSIRRVASCGRSRGSFRTPQCVNHSSTRCVNVTSFMKQGKAH